MQRDWQSRFGGAAKMRKCGVCERVFGGERWAIIFGEHLFFGRPFFLLLFISTVIIQFVVGTGEEEEAGDNSAV